MGAGRATTAAGVKLFHIEKSRGGALPSFHVRDGEDRDKGREGYLGIGKVNINIAGDRLDVVVAGDQGQRARDGDVDELIQRNLGPVYGSITELGSQERVRVARR